MLLEEAIDKAIDESTSLKGAMKKLRQYLTPSHLDGPKDLDLYYYRRSYIARACWVRRPIHMSHVQLKRRRRRG